MDSADRRELERFLAERVMGWIVRKIFDDLDFEIIEPARGGYFMPNEQHPHGTWNPTKNMRQAWMLQGKIAENPELLRAYVRELSDDIHREWEALKGLHGIYWTFADGAFATAEQRCLAMRRAIVRNDTRDESSDNYRRSKVARQELSSREPWDREIQRQGVGSCDQCSKPILSVPWYILCGGDDTDNGVGVFCSEQCCRKWIVGKDDYVQFG